MAVASSGRNKFRFSMIQTSRFWRHFLYTYAFPNTEHWFHLNDFTLRPRSLSTSFFFFGSPQKCREMFPCGFGCTCLWQVPWI